MPEEHRHVLAKTDIALVKIDQVIAAGARFGRVVADAGYGISAAFRHGCLACLEINAMAVDLASWVGSRTSRLRYWGCLS